jgi:putative transcriptional regulator
MVKLDDVLYARRMTLTELSERIGITLANLSILKTGKARAVRFSTLEAICEALECQPTDAWMTIINHQGPWDRKWSKTPSRGEGSHGRNV